MTEVCVAKHMIACSTITVDCNADGNQDGSSESWDDGTHGDVDDGIRWPTAESLNDQGTEGTQTMKSKCGSKHSPYGSYVRLHGQDQTALIAHTEKIL